MLYDGISLAEGTAATNFTIASGTSNPATPTTGELFYRTDSPNEGLYVYTGTEWQAVGSGNVSFDSLNVKPAVRAATTANITLSGTQTIDGVSVIAGDRVLVKNQNTGSQNGIYVVASGSWTRSTDFDGSPSTEVKAGDFVFVTEGTTNADTGWVLATNGTITIGTTALTFSQFSSGSSALTSTYIGYGSGSNLLTGSTKFIWDDAATSLFIGLTGTAGTISAPTSSTTPAPLTIKGGNTTTASQTGGAVQVIGGSSTLGAVGGEVIIKGGAATAGNFNGGSVSIIGGASNGQATGGSVTISAGPYVSGNSTGGNISITAGTGGGTGTPGTVTITGGVVPANSTSRSSAWTNVVITGGEFDPPSFTTTFAADVRISGGSLNGSTGVSTEVYTIGSVYISGGVGGGHVNQAGGAVIFSTAPGTTLIERFRILNTGAWSVGSTGTAYGTAGQVLTSNGNAAPTWQAASSSFTKYDEFQGSITASATTNIDCSLANNFTVTMSANITTLTFSNIPASGRNYSVTLYVTQDATGGREIVWPAAVKWPNGTAPSLSTGANKIDVITLVTYNAGTSWLGFVSAQNM